MCFSCEALRKGEVLPGQERENCIEEERAVERETVIIIYEAKKTSRLRSGVFCNASLTHTCSKILAGKLGDEKAYVRVELREDMI